MLAKSSTELVRLQNSILVLRAIRLKGGLAHTEIADFTGLSSATVSAITADLERARVLERSEVQVATKRGRPRVLFTQRRDCAYLIAAIVSSDAIQYSLADYSGRLIDRFVEPRGEGGAGQFLASIRRGLDRITERSSLSAGQVRAISISSKGLVDPAEPVLLWSPVLGSERVNFASGLADRWASRVILSNETLLVARALALRAEKEKGETIRGLATLSLGHSIGLGLAIRRPQAGLELTAPNFGHMLHVPAGALCRCGAKGCIEAYAGFYAMLRNAFEVPRDTIPAKFVPLAEVDKLASSARNGARRPGYAFREAGLALGYGLSRLISLNGHLPIAITGPGARYFDLLQAGLLEGLSQSQAVNMEGMPEISVVEDEPQLVFEGHLERALDLVDRDIVMAMP